MVGVIYVHINKINGKRYVGQTIDNPERRFRKNDKTYRTYKGSTVFYKALNKYGWDNFETVLLASATTQENLDYLETYFIKLFNCYLPNGYNSVIGAGQHVIYTKEVRDKISKSKLGKRTNKPAPNARQKVLINEVEHLNCPKCNKLKPTIEFLKIKRKGLISNSSYCKVCLNINRKKYRNPPKYKNKEERYSLRKTEVYKQTMSKKIKETFKNNDKLKQLISKKRSKPVIGINPITNETIRFSSALEARKNGFNNTNLSIAIRDKKLFKGYYWSFDETQ